MEPPKKGGKAALWIFLAVVCLALAAGAVFLVRNDMHIWSEATCTQAAVCRLCGQTEGEPLGHDWSEGSCIVPGKCLRCAENAEAPRGHQWIEASCTEPQTCTVCGQTGSDALGHDWTEGSCTEAIECLRCSEVGAEAGGHIWAEATFQNPKTCTICAQTEGSALSYTDVNVQSQVAWIHRACNETDSARNADSYSQERLREGVTAYYDGSGQLRCVVVESGAEGLGDYSRSYSRTYYYSDGKLIFALCRADDTDSFYFYEGLLMRWHHDPTDGDGATYDFDFSQDYIQWEWLLLDESKAFLR